MPDLSTLLPRLTKVAQNLARLRAGAAPPNEANTKGALIEPVLAALGWDISNPEVVSREWRGADGGKGNPVDYALFPGPGQPPALLVEAKPLGQDLEDLSWIGQITGYANTQDVAWCVLTDGAHWDVYKAHARGRGVEKRFFRASLDDPSAHAPDFRLLCRDALSPPLLEQAWEMRELRVRVETALQEDADDRKALVRRLRRRLPDLTPREIERILSTLPHLSSPRPAPKPAPVFAPASATSGDRHDGHAMQDGEPPRRRCRRMETSPTEPPRQAAPGNQTHARTASPGATPPVPDPDGIACRMPDGEAEARLSRDLRRMILLAGALLNRTPMESLPSTAKRILAEMHAAGVLEEAGHARWRLRRDWPVGSPSTAASVVRGASWNGWAAWCLDDGRSIDALRRGG
jgi:hypothetical protein